MENKNKYSFSFLVVWLLFLLSGLSSLIYQVIWTRMLTLVFGSTSFASSTVLSVFMGGLAAGSFFAGKYSDKLKNPFLWYGILEGIIGLWAILAPFLFDAAIPLYKIAWQQMHLSVLPFSLLRFTFVALILLVPTACMGATLPLLSRFVTNSLDIVGNRVGTLYSVNTLGAVFGAVLAGFLLIPKFGLSLTTFIAAAINIMLTVLVLSFTKIWSIETIIPDHSETEKDNSDRDTNKLSKLPLPAKATLIAFGISGAISMVYEVSWTRALLMVIGSTTYAFSVMLSTFLIGIFAGSFIASKIVDKIKEPVVWFAILELLVCAGGFLSIQLFNYLPYWNLAVNLNLSTSNPTMGMITRFLLSGAVLVPITLALGATFPFAVKACTQDLEKVGKSVGSLYSVNTLGAIIGAFAAGFFIIPYLGTEKSLLICSTVNFLLGLILLISFANLRPSIRIVSGIAGAFLLLWSINAASVWDLRLILSSQLLRRSVGLLYKDNKLPAYDSWMSDVTNTSKILYENDGLCSNVAITKFANGTVSMLTNGHVDASDGGDMSNQALISAIPLMFRPQSKNLAIIGWGSGVTLGYGFVFPLERLVCVEIEPSVIEASKFFHHVNFAPEQDKRLDLEVNDGRNFLLATNELFDVIVSEPSNPWQAGVCNLYTKEYFKICHERLKPGGIFTMWWQHGEVSSDNLSRVFAALKSVFKHTIVFNSSSVDICVLCSDNPIKFNLNDLKQEFKNPKVRDSLAIFGILTPEDLAAKLCISDEGINKIISGKTPNSDDKNHIEYDVARTYEQRSFNIQNRQWLKDNAGPLWDTIDWSNMSPKDKALAMASIAEHAIALKADTAGFWAQESLKTEENPYAYCILAVLESNKGNFKSSLQLFDKAIQLNTDPKDSRWLLARGQLEMRVGMVLAARRDFELAAKISPNNPTFQYKIASTYLASTPEDWSMQALEPMNDIGKAEEDPKKAFSLLEPLLNNKEWLKRYPTALYLAGVSAAKLNLTDKAIDLLQQFNSQNTNNPFSWRLLAKLYEQKGNNLLAANAWCNSFQIGQNIAPQLGEKAKGLINMQKYPQALTCLKTALDLFPFCPEAKNALAELSTKYKPATNLLEEFASINKIDKEVLEKLKLSHINH